MIPRLVGILSDLDHVHFVRLVLVRIERLTDKKTFHLVEVTVLELGEALTGIVYLNLDELVILTVLPRSTYPTVTGNTAHLQYLISELQFIGFPPMVHKKLFSDPFETRIDLIRVVAFHL